MKKIIIASLLASNIGSAFAEWTPVSETDLGRVYMDIKTIRKEGHTRIVWLIYDLKQRNKNGEMSYRLRKEYDCKEERIRTHVYSLHSESMANGQTLFNQSSLTPWREIAPDTMAASELEMVCTK